MALMPPMHTTNAPTRGKSDQPRRESNPVPVFADKPEEAAEIARMRR
jgi:hypothetical protein